MEKELPGLFNQLQTALLHVSKLDSHCRRRGGMDLFVESKTVVALTVQIAALCGQLISTKAGFHE